jgi:8-hydroxy-5-deazaflavin:NADPH oxidoreductase
MMNIAFIGIGKVGSALADNLVKVGHKVIIAGRNLQSDSVKSALALNPEFSAMPVAEALAKAEVVFLATPFPVNAEALAGLNLAGKILVDCTNPVGAGLTHGLESRTSGAEDVQRLAPGARVVKAFTIYGFENLQNSSYPGYGQLKPAMLIAGDDPAAKQTVGKIADQLGWRAVDVGPLASALHLEHMTLLWIKMARMQGKGVGFVWAMLER